MTEDKLMNGKSSLESRRLTLRPLRPEDASEAYLSWLNDPDILRFRAPQVLPATFESMKDYILSIPRRGDLVLAIRLKDGGRHIGNVALNTILWTHRTAELSMMIGAKDLWGQKLGKEAIHAVARHGFRSMGLHRIWAESPNPAFNGAVESLGWSLEGTKRAAFLLDGKHVDVRCYGLLAGELKPRPELEPA